MQATGDSASPWWLNYLPLLVLVVVIALRWRRMHRARPLRPRLMLVGPVVYALILAGLFIVMPPSAIGWLCFAGGLAIGALVGWQRARLMRLHVDPDHGKVMVRQSPAALLLIVGLAFARRLMLPHDVGAATADGEVPASLLYITDGLFGFALGMIAAQAIALWRRANALIAAHRSQVFS